MKNKLNDQLELGFEQQSCRPRDRHERRRSRAAHWSARMRQAVDCAIEPTPCVPRPFQTLNPQPSTLNHSSAPPPRPEQIALPFHSVTTVESNVAADKQQQQ